MSTLLIRESTDFDSSTEDNFDLAQENVLDTNEYGKKICKSNDTIDKRLVKIYRLKHWKEDYKSHKGLTKAFDEFKENLKPPNYQDSS